MTAILAGDQVTKLSIEAVLIDPPRVSTVTSFFNLALGYNRGISFGLFRSDHAYAPYVLASLLSSLSRGSRFGYCAATAQSKNWDSPRLLVGRSATYSTGSKTGR